VFLAVVRLFAAAQRVRAVRYGIVLRRATSVQTIRFTS